MGWASQQEGLRILGAQLQSLHECRRDTGASAGVGSEGERGLHMPYLEEANEHHS